jgi:hypothetical protein
MIQQLTGEWREFKICLQPVCCTKGPALPLVDLCVYSAEPYLVFLNDLQMVEFMYPCDFVLDARH